MNVCKQCGDTFPNTMIIDDEVRVLNSRRHCLKCLPFKQKLRIQKNPCCIYCGETNPDNFYGHKKKVCAKCHNQDVKKKGHEKRRFAVEYLGGKCVACGFDKYPCSLDIHHLNPENKDENFAHIRGWNKERILVEIENCILLCKNCHSGFHNGYEIFK